jgi:protein TonB
MRFGLLAVAVSVLGVMIVTGQEIPGKGAILPPKVMKVVKATYTPDAKAARIEGVVRLDAVVMSDGTVGDDVKVIQSLDTKFGLDEQAVKASKQWRFKPGTKDGEPVAVHVTIEQFFSLRSK